MPRPETTRTAIKPLRDFLAAESAGGILVLGAAVTALLWANSPWRTSYEQLWTTGFEVRVGSLVLASDLRHFVNEALMTVFFLVVGLEIKREVVEGELRDPARRALPVFAAVGGMALPALIYAGITLGAPEQRAWGIPMATDIALAVGVITLARNVAPALKLFLLALAIVDDIGAILVIGIFYAGDVEFGWIGAGAVAVLTVLMLRKLGVEAIWAYVAVGCGLWFAVRQGGIHATLAGVIMGLLAPTSPRLSSDLSNEGESAGSVVEQLEHRLHPWSSFLIVPIFALANAGIPLSAGTLRAAATSPIAWGVVAGLLIGKPVGIVAASAAAVRMGAATLPPGVTWGGIGGAGLLAGVGFTVSLFIADVALSGAAADNARLGILAASIVAGSTGLFVLRRLARSGQPATGTRARRLP